MNFLLGVFVAAALAAATLPAHAAFEFGDASPGSLGAASLEGPRAWLVPGGDGVESPGGVVVAFSHATLFDAPDLAADAAALAAGVGGLAGEIGVTIMGADVGGGAIRERAIRATLREGGRRAIRLSATAERLDLEIPVVDGVETRGGWCLGFGATAAHRLGATSWEMTAAAERAVRGRTLAALGVVPEFRVEASLQARFSRLTVADRWSADGRHLARVAAEIPVGNAASLRFGRSGSPARIGGALAVRVGGIVVSVGRLEDPSAATVNAVEFAFAKREASRKKVELDFGGPRGSVVGPQPVCYHAYR